MKTKQTQKNIPNGWSSVKLMDICDVNQGLQIPISERFNKPNKNRKVYITTQYLNGKSEAEYIENYSDSVVCSKKDILMTRTGNSGIVITGVEGVFHNNFFKVKPRKNINSKLLVYNLLSPHVQHKLLKLAGASTIPDLNHGDFYSIEILLASLGEQKLIVEVLETWDKVIEKLGRRIEIKKNIKKGLMQNLLTGKIRLAGFSGEWKKIEIGKLCDMSRGGSPRPIQDYLTDNLSGFNWLRIGDVPVGGKYINHISAKITKDGLKNTTLVKKGDFILSNSMSFGRPYIMQIDACIHDGWLALKNLKSNTVDKDFLYYLLLTRKIQHIFQSISAGSGVQNLKKETVSAVKIKLPSTKEQTAIANILTTADNEIESLEKKKEIIEAQKKYLLNNLITGKIRTPENL